MFIPELIRKEALRQGLRPRTIQTYQQCIGRFFRRCHKDPLAVRKDDIKHFLDLLIERGAPGSTINVYLNALKFFYEQILHRKLTVNVRYSKAPTRLPEFLTQEEIAAIFAAIDNHKHSLMIRLLYSSGMRVSELLNLKVKDLDSAFRHGWVRNGKGGKDRPFIIAAKLQHELKVWVEQNKLHYDGFVFWSYDRKQYDDSSVREILKRAAKKANIQKKVYPHMLRHSFATHLLEQGYAITDVQPLLGHSRLETTLVYTHLAAPKLLAVQSPYDALTASKTL